MKKVLIISLLMFAVPVMAEELETVKMTPFLVSSTDSNMPALDPNTDTCWQQAKDWNDISTKHNRLAVMFFVYGDGDGAGDPNGGTFDYQFYTAPKQCNGRMMASGDATVGFAHLSHHPVSGAQLAGGSVDPNHCWVDTLGAITEDLPDTVGAENDDGTDDVACFIFDRRFADKAHCRIYNICGITKVYCIAYGY